MLPALSENRARIRLPGGPARFVSQLVDVSAGQNPHTLAAEKKRREAKAAPPAPPALPPTIIVVSQIEQPLHPALPPVPHSSQTAPAVDDDTDMKDDSNADTKERPDRKITRRAKRKQPEETAARSEPLDVKEKRQRCAARDKEKPQPAQQQQRTAASILLTTADANSSARLHSSKCAR